MARGSTRLAPTRSFAASARFGGVSCNLRAVVRATLADRCDHSDRHNQKDHLLRGSCIYLALSRRQCNAVIFVKHLSLPNKDFRRSYKVVSLVMSSSGHVRHELGPNPPKPLAWLPSIRISPLVLSIGHNGRPFISKRILQNLAAGLINDFNGAVCG
jgi:hypothetical protein